MNRTVIIPRNQTVYSNTHNPNYVRNQQVFVSHYQQPVLNYHHQNVIIPQQGIQMRQISQNSLKIMNERAAQEKRFVILNGTNSPIIRVPQNNVVFKNHYNTNNHGLSQTQKNIIIEHQNDRKITQDSYKN